MFVKMLLTSNETIVQSVLLEIGKCLEYCRKLFKERDSQRVHLWLNEPEQERMGLRGIPGLCSLGNP